MVTNVNLNGMSINAVGDVEISITPGTEKIYPYKNSLEAYCSGCDADEHIEFIAPKEKTLVIFCARCKPDYTGKEYE